jgi:hypothetical protein
VITAAESVVIIAIVAVVCRCRRRIHGTGLLHSRTVLRTWLKAWATKVRAKMVGGLSITGGELCRNAGTVPPRDVGLTKGSTREGTTIVGAVVLLVHQAHGVECDRALRGVSPLSKRVGHVKTRTIIASTSSRWGRTKSHFVTGHHGRTLNGTIRICTLWELRRLSPLARR